MGAGTSPAEPEFVCVCVVIQRTFRQLLNGRLSPNLVTKRTSVSRRGIRKHIFKNVHFRPPKSEIENQSNKHFTQSRLQVTECNAERYCLLDVVFQGSGSFRGRSTFLYDCDDFIDESSFAANLFTYLLWFIYIYIYIHVYIYICLVLHFGLF